MGTNGQSCQKKKKKFLKSIFISNKAYNIINHTQYVFLVKMIAFVIQNKTAFRIDLFWGFPRNDAHKY